MAGPESGRVTTLRKIALVLGGYILAFGAALALTWSYIRLTPQVDRVGSSGMTAFGDSFFFLMVFAAASLPATGATLYFLRGSRRFWVALATAAVAVAVTGIVSLLISLVPYGAPVLSRLHGWDVVTPLRALAAPFFALLFLLSGLFSPIKGARVALLGATAGEATVFGVTVFRWILGLRS
jgi:hypothetical protein